MNLLKNKNANMHLNSEVKQIIFDKNKSLYRIQYNNKIIYGEKIIFCIPKPSLLKIDILNDMDIEIYISFNEYEKHNT